MPGSEHHLALQDVGDILSRPGVRESVNRLLFTESVTGIAYLSAEGVFIAANLAFCDLIGYTPSELVGRKRWQDITVGDDRETEQMERDEVIKGIKNVAVIRKTYLHKSGWVVPVVLKINRVEDSGGNFALIVGQARDEFLMRRRRDSEGNQVTSPSRAIVLDDVTLGQISRSIPPWVKKSIAGAVVAAFGIVGAQLGLSWSNSTAIQDASQKTEVVKQTTEDKYETLSHKLDALMKEQQRLANKK